MNIYLHKKNKNIHQVFIRDGEIVTQIKCQIIFILIALAFRDLVNSITK